MPFERPPSPSFLLATPNMQDDFQAHMDLNCEVPSITVERPHSPFSSSSQYSSEPLDTELWEQRSHDRSAFDGSSSSSSSPSSQPSSPLNSPMETESPPDYQTTVKKPTVVVQYQFLSTSYNTMTVVPNSDGEDSRHPKYHISVSMNCFMPLNHITTIRRGGSELGELVAQFEMGISGSESTFMMNGAELPINSALSKRMGNRQCGLWFWIPPSRSKATPLLWDLRQMPFICRSILDVGAGVEDSSLATFTPARQVKAGQRPALGQLTVTPKGQEFFDHLLLAILIIERKRLTPGKDRVLKQLFN